MKIDMLNIGTLCKMDILFENNSSFTNIHNNQFPFIVFYFLHLLKITDTFVYTTMGLLKTLCEWNEINIPKVIS